MLVGIVMPTLQASFV